ncbi:MAG: hypothetical protein HYY25_05785 [Candidatus Wallbacteria bacterium]|nr:hypothetical protein [Candidatus Wallbacteria bacterium]
MVDEKLIEEIVRRVLESLAGQGRGGAREGAGSVEKPGTAHAGRVLSEWDILTAHRSGKGWISVTRKTIITPLARDRARDLGVELVVRDS